MSLTTYSPVEVEHSHWWVEGTSPGVLWCTKCGEYMEIPWTNDYGNNKCRRVSITDSALRYERRL